MRNEIVSVSLPNTLVHISYQKLDASYLCLVHLHDEIELLRVKTGKVSCVVGDDEYVAHAGEVIFVNSRVPHIVTNAIENTELILVQYKIDNFIDNSKGKIGTDLARFSEYTDRKCCILRDCLELCNHIDLMYRELTEKNEGYEEYIKSGIYASIAYLTRRGVIENNNRLLEEPSIARIMPALEYIDENYQRDISLDEISGVLNINPYYFCRLFKNATGSSFCEYLNFVRISKSEKLFKIKGKSITEISLDVGFSSVTYFNRIFRKFKGCTPTVYRKAQNA